MNNPLRWFACACLGALLSAHAADLDALKAELKKADSDFCALAASAGVKAAFAKYAAPDCVFPDVSPERLKGGAAVDARFAGAPPGISLSWTPEFADAGASGDLGYTWGRYEAAIPKDDGTKVVHTGHYVTLWKRQSDGAWKVVLDTGVADPPPKK